MLLSEHFGKGKTLTEITYTSMIITLKGTQKQRSGDPNMSHFNQ